MKEDKVEFIQLLLLFPACLSEPATKSWQLCDVAPQHAGLEAVQQQEPDEEWTETKRCSVRTPTEPLCLIDSDGDTHAICGTSCICNVSASPPVFHVIMVDSVFPRISLNFVATHFVDNQGILGQIDISIHLWARHCHCSTLESTVDQCFYYKITVFQSFF